MRPHGLGAQIKGSRFTLRNLLGVDSLAAVYREGAAVALCRLAPQVGTYIYTYIYI